MLTVVVDNTLSANAITAADPAAAAAALTGATGLQAAGLAIAASKHVAAIPALVLLLSEDGVAGQAAAWALGQLASENAVCTAIPDGRLDTRQNGYHALATLAARGAASATLAGFLEQRIAAEVERAKSGGTGLADQACKALAVIGHPRFAELIQQVIEGDRFCDRFELDRLRTAVADHGRDREGIRELTAAWTTIFADHLPKAAVSAAEAAPASPLIGANPSALPPTKKPATTQAPAAKAPAPRAKAPADAIELPPDQDDELSDPAAMDGDAASDAASDAEGPAQAQRIDWKAFATSPEFTGLSTQSQGLITQLGPLLEQLSAQAIRAALADLSGQEFAALLLQVLPQALQPQAVQMALHPQALNGYQALATWLARTGVATAGDELVLGVKLVRKQLREQIRRSGMLGGPDYSDPDDATAVPKA